MSFLRGQFRQKPPPQSSLSTVQLELLNAEEIVPRKTADRALFRAIHRKKNPRTLFAAEFVCLYLPLSSAALWTTDFSAPLSLSDGAHFWTLLTAAVHFPRSRQHSANCTLSSGWLGKLKTPLWPCNYGAIRFLGTNSPCHRVGKHYQWKANGLDDGPR